MTDYRFADMTDIPHDCRDCKNNDKQWYEMPCDACCPAHCGFEKKEKSISRYIDAIDRGRLIRDILDEYGDTGGTEDASKIFRMILNQPTADVVEVVRCKDCLHESYCEDVLWCNITDEPMCEDDYCSKGERADK